MSLGLMEILILGFFFVFFVAVIGGVILMVTKGSNRNRVSELERRVERLEHQLDRMAELTAQKDSALK